MVGLPKPFDDRLGGQGRQPGRDGLEPGKPADHGRHQPQGRQTRQDVISEVGRPGEGVGLQFDPQRPADRLQSLVGSRARP